MAFVLIEHLDHLRLGLYIKIKGSWFSHPFPVSTFKIKNTKELDTLRNLKRVKLYYDPARSEPDPNPPPPEETIESPPEFPQLAAADMDESADRLLEDEDLEGSTHKEMPSLSQEESAAYHKQRSRLFHEQIQELRKVEGTYAKVLRESESIFNNLVAHRPESIHSARKVVSGLVDVFQGQAVSMTLMEVLGRNGLGWGLSTHSLNVSIMSLLIADELDLPKDHLLPLGLGALFHDLGERLVPMKVKFMEGGMKMQSDPSLHKLHPEKGYEWLQKFPAYPAEALDIVLHHHERLNGTGYPKGLGQEDLGLLAQIVMVADEYDEMCNAPRKEDRRTPHEALGLLYRAFLGKDSHKFSEEVVQALIRALTVYPPGTYVQLSDDSYGLVTSINRQNPTNPLVMLYTPQEINNEATIIDLARDEHLKIQHVLHPGDLPTKVFDRLSRRHVAVFLHAAEEVTHPIIRDLSPDAPLDLPTAPTAPFNE